MSSPVESKRYVRIAIASNASCWDWGSKVKLPVAIICQGVKGNTMNRIDLSQCPGRTARIASHRAVGASSARSLVHVPPAVAAPIVCCTTGVAPKKPSFWFAAVPICVPVVVPSVRLTPSANEPQTMKHCRLSVIDVIVLEPVTTVASLTWGVAGYESGDEQGPGVRPVEVENARRRCRDRLGGRSRQKCRPCRPA